MQNAMCTDHEYSKSQHEEVPVADWGILPYRDALERQTVLFQHLIDLKREGTDTAGEERLVLVEHPPVFTLGRHGHAENMLRQLPGVELVKIARGGDITFHGPGQLVAYPVIDLQRHHLGVKDYVHLLEETVIRTIAEYGIKGERVEGATGVWIDKDTSCERKICAIGVKCSRFVTMHGLALNVNTNLEYFHAINPCGFTDKGVTSLRQELAREVPVPEVKAIFARTFNSLL